MNEMFAVEAPEKPNRLCLFAHDSVLAARSRPRLNYYIAAPRRRPTNVSLSINVLMRMVHFFSPSHLTSEPDSVMT